MSQQSAAEEAKAIRGIWKNKLEKDETWCVLEAKWFKKWCKYTGFNPKESDPQHGVESMTIHDAERPGPIDNTPVLEEHSRVELKKDLVEEADYVVVHEHVWAKLQEWYGGGPCIDRVVITVGIRKETRLDFFPIFLKIVWLGANGEPDESHSTSLRFTRRDTFKNVVDALLDQLRKQPEFKEDEKGESVRLWMKEEKKDDQGKVVKEKWVTIKENIMGQALESFQFPPNFYVWAEKKTTDGKWARSTVKENFRDYEVGDILDAQDTVKKWYESTVVAVKPENKTVLIHFNGWESRWDEWMPFDSERIAKQGTYSTGPYLSKSVASGGYGGWGSWSSSEEGTPVEAGVVGLRNLGNTCFMNSTLQCLSNTPILTEYFVEDRYTQEINRDNPLGWQGRVADEYGAMLKEMWGGKFRVVAPSKFKQVLGEFQPRFSGYQQQDSSELLSFLLDGLHEDLNQVRQKPATKAVESDGRPDHVVAKEAWETYQMRNKSIVVKSFQGQLKSTVQCPECKRVSITFDPYMFLSVPLPQASDKPLSLTFVSADPTKSLLQISPMVPKVALITELKAAISKLMNVSANALVLADVWRGRIHRFLEDDDSVGDIRSNDTIYVYELPELLEGNGNKLKPIAVPNFVMQGEARSDATGMPFVITIPKDLEITTTGIREKIVRATRMCTPQGRADPFKIIMVDSNGSFCAKCDWSARCNGCELPKEDIPVNKLDTRYRFTVAVQWASEADYDTEKLKIQNHESVKAAAAVSAPHSEPTLDIATCINSFTRDEVLGENDAWYCSKCKKHQQASKKFDIWTLPDILIIHMKRFSYTRIYRDKITTFVDFPYDLNMSPFVVNPQETDNKYELYAVSNHMGGMGGGHYTAYGRNLINDKWYLFDDSHVQEVSKEQVKSASAYVLFYKRKSIRQHK